MKLLSIKKCIFLHVIVYFYAVSAFAEQVIEEGHSGERGPEIQLTTEQISLAEIKATTINAQIMSSYLMAPGEIKANGYNSYYVSPRVESVILKRHAKLGDVVNKGQPLVTLFSEIVAQAQADYRLAHADWFRVRNLTSVTVSEQKKLAIQTEHVATSSRLKAYGLSKSAIKEVINDINLPLGEYTLIAQQAGAVLSDDFHQGQRIAGGKTIMVLADESELWVEAKLPATETTQFAINSHARVLINNVAYQGKVIQAAHTIDPLTRTRIVRLLVNNQQHQLHAGMFVDVAFSVVGTEPIIAVPQSALIRSADGDWQIFIEHEQGEYLAQEVELGRVLQVPDGGNFTLWQEIINVEQGTDVVVSGAFFIASQAAKSGFDIHNH